MANKANEWIQAYRNAYAAAEGSKTYDAATRELMHDALAAVFSKEKNTQRFIDWLGNTQTKKNANKIKSWFAELLKKLKSAIHSLFTEGKLNPMQMDVGSLQEEKLESLADMFLDALDESKAKVQNTTKKEAVEASEVKNALTIKMDKMTTGGNMNDVVNMKPVANLSGTEFAKGDVDLISQVETYFDSLGNEVQSKYGLVELTRKGIKSSIGHGIGRNKAIAFTAVPDVIKKGKVIDYQYNWKGRGYDTAVFAAPITIGNEGYYLGCVVNVESNRNYYYLHEVILQKKENNAMFKTGTVKNGTSGKALSPLHILLQRIQNVNTSSNISNDIVNQIVVLPDGTPVVWIEDNIFKGKKGSDAKIVADYLKNNIGKVYTILESGQCVYLGKDLPGEYTYSEYSKKLQNSRSLLKAKNKAASGLGEMIEIATNRRWEPTDHTHNKDAKYGVYKYDTKFAFPIFDSAGNVTDARAFDAELLILNASDGKKYLYDLLKIKRNATTSGDLTKMKTRNVGTNPRVQRSNASNNSISQPNQNVNTSSGISDEDVGNQIRINGQDLAHIDDNEELKAIVVDMIEQKRRTSKSRRNILSKDVRPFAKQILSDNSSSYNLTTFTSELTKLYELMARGEREDVIRHYANYIGEKILEASDNNGKINDRNKSILNDIKGIPMKLTKAQRDILSDKYGLSFEEYSAKNSRYMTFSANGRYIHDIWSELSSKYPDVFDSSMPKSEMAIELAGIAVQLSNTYNGEFSLSDDAQYLGAELVAGFDTVGTTKRTGADIEAEKVSEIKRIKNEKISEIRAKKNEQIEKLKILFVLWLSFQFF
ncbi:MAG: hypothetical protein IKU52_04500 [Clostridia bacterium]|nr:hypothetical protein [Clostridia bacterium]